MSKYEPILFDSTSRELCKLCYHVNAVGFHVPDRVWCSIVPEQARNGIVCLACFTRLGDEKGIPWDQDIEFFPVSLATHFALVHVDTVLYRSQSYAVDMAVDGRLDALYVHGDQPQFFVFDPITDRGIKCYFAEGDVDSVVELLKRRVRVFGVARFNRRHEIISVQVESFERLPEQEEVPTIDEMRAAKIDITGGMDAADYIRRMRYEGAISEEQREAALAAMERAMG